MGSPNLGRWNARCRVLRRSVSRLLIVHSNLKGSFSNPICAVRVLTFFQVPQDVVQAAGWWGSLGLRGEPLQFWSGSFCLHLSDTWCQVGLPRAMVLGMKEACSALIKQRACRLWARCSACCQEGAQLISHSDCGSSAWGDVPPLLAEGLSVFDPSSLSHKGLYHWEAGWLIVKAFNCEIFVNSPVKVIWVLRSGSIPFFERNVIFTT